LAIYDALGARTAAQAEALKLRPLAAALATRRADLKEVAPWTDKRPSLAPGLHALAKALPDGNADDQVRLVRVRQVDGEDTVVEGAASDRAQMVAYLDRLRRDARVTFAEIRSSRSPSKESKSVVFELVVKVGEGFESPADSPNNRKPGNTTDEQPSPSPAKPETPEATPAPEKTVRSHDLLDRGNGGRHAEA
jgi:Tfp pilus assembly protein PilN